MTKHTVAILGLGAISNRHLEAIKNNSQYYTLVGVYDIDSSKAAQTAAEFQVKNYNSEQELLADGDINTVVILTPSHLHYTQMINAVRANKHVIVEKPATFASAELNEVLHLAKQHKVNVFTVLQVRLNPSIITLRHFIQQQKMGNIRGVTLTQRWQRPLAYFTGWRGQMATSGGILREFSIHYLDALIYLLGMPNKVTNASFYQTKFKQSDIADTIYAQLDFADFGGNIEVLVAAEPSNLECSLAIMSDVGYVKLGGKSLDVIVEAKFLEESLAQELQQYYAQITAQSKVALASQGASPYHPELYRQIVESPEQFKLEVTYNAINLIEQIYSLCL